MKSARWISYALLLWINCIFVYKYAARTPLGSLPALTGYLVLFIGGVIVLEKFRAAPRLKLLLYRLLLPLWAIVLILSLFFVNESNLKVDRFSMIDLFWNNFFSGINPYLPREVDTNTPGPFPFYFLFFLPFKLFGDIAIANLLALGALVALTFRRFSASEAKPLVIFLMVISPALGFEVLTRSTIFINAMAAILFFEMLLASPLTRMRSIIGAGVLAGIIASTRAIAVLWLIAMVMYCARVNGWKPRSAINAGVIAIIVFVAPFGGLWALFPGSFLRCNPFRVQSEFLPFFFAPVAAAAFIAAGLLVKKAHTLFYFLGFASYGMLAPYIISQLARYGLRECLFRHKIDISYQVFCIPFLLAALLLERTGHGNLRKSVL